MEAEHKQAAVRPRVIQRLLEAACYSAAVGLEAVLERPPMCKQGFGLRFMDAVVDIPEPQIGFRQSIAHRLRACDRYQPLLIGSSKQYGDPHPWILPSSFPVARLYLETDLLAQSVWLLRLRLGTATMLA